MQGSEHTLKSLKSHMKAFFLTPAHPTSFTSRRRRCLKNTWQWPVNHFWQCCVIQPSQSLKQATISPLKPCVISPVTSSQPPCFSHLRSNTTSWLPKAVGLVKLHLWAQRRKSLGFSPRKKQNTAQVCNYKAPKASFSTITIQFPRWGCTTTTWY